MAIGHFLVVVLLYDRAGDDGVFLPGDGSNGGVGDQIKGLASVANFHD